MSGLPREVLRWIQSLDLTWKVKTPKWDLSNGYLVAEIFSWYFPLNIQMHSFYSGTSMESKSKNWGILKTFIKRQHLDIPDDYIEGAIHCKEGASGLLVERLYEILTNRRVRKMTSDSDVDFTDWAYQEKLPMHARSTATKAVKNNLRLTEVMAEPSLIAQAQKAQRIITDHVDHRRIERMEDPSRFRILPTIGERSIRRHPPASQENTDLNQSTKDDTTTEEQSKREQTQESMNPERESGMTYKEINVHQLDKAQLYDMPIQSC
ncbi:spermatogenesis-associated protein 4-like [Gigantopelta aegis]|uniref:spermatogenesis-associated protein 4-like n=1 Tax=Gigantopelta aegis TaxID=1735272 RepID=UPI001B88E6B1|nr:spermatogenesis-associated protein 4-like [Gigantopelta aegis]